MDCYTQKVVPPLSLPPPRLEKREMINLKNKPTPHLPGGAAHHPARAAATRPTHTSIVSGRKGFFLLRLLFHFGQCLTPPGACSIDHLLLGS